MCQPGEGPSRQEGFGERRRFGDISLFSSCWLSPAKGCPRALWWPGPVGQGPSQGPALSCAFPAPGAKEGRGGSKPETPPLPLPTTAPSHPHYAFACLSPLDGELLEGTGVYCSHSGHVASASHKEGSDGWHLLRLSPGVLAPQLSSWPPVMAVFYEHTHWREGS